MLLTTKWIQMDQRVRRFTDKFGLSSKAVEAVKNNRPKEVIRVWNLNAYDNALSPVACKVTGPGTGPAWSPEGLD
jgi:hypothetical protein